MSLLMTWQLVVAQSLSDYTSGGLLKAALDDLAAAVGGEQVFGLLVSGALLLTFYIASNGRLGAASSLTALSGGVMISTLPPAYRGVAQIVIFLGLAVAVAGLLNKYVNRP